MTQIFDSYQDFLNREDNSANGVSAAFAEQHPNWVEDNATNKNCWNCWLCWNCESCKNCVNCESCKNCVNCESCKNCVNCESCKNCWNCVSCKEKVSNTGTLDIPIIENIHAKVLAETAASEAALDMSDWHTCDTTHCRAGWVVHLAGAAGYKLEKQTSPAFASMMIYKKSSNIEVPYTRFYESNDAAMQDIIRCANEEQLLNKNK